MNPTEKQDYIDKIQNLIESNEEENLSLAVQLMEGLDLKEEVLSLYGFEDNLLQFNSILEPENYRKLLAKLDIIMGIFDYQSSLKRRVFNSVVELLQIHYKQIEVLDEKIKIDILFTKKHLEIKSITIAKDKHIDKAISEINLLNPLLKKELIDYYKSKIKGGGYPTGGGAGFGWIDIRRKSKNPIDYQIQPYEENSEYAIFTVIVKVDII